MTTLSPAPTSTLFTRALNRGDLGLFVLALFFVAVQPPLEKAVSIVSVIDALARQNLFILFAQLAALKRFSRFI